jgi:uncharacterized metal-binding protein
MLISKLLSLRVATLFLGLLYAPQSDHYVDQKQRWLVMAVN